jgi:uncharacterized protein
MAVDSLPPVAVAVRAQVAARFAGDAGGHDLAHLDRVAGMGDRLARAEGADREVVGAAAYCHDFHRLVERESGHARPVASADCEELVVATLAAAGAAARLTAPVVACVAFCDRHVFAGDDGDGPLEAQVLRDADNLDAIGAVGIARAFAFGAQLGEPLWIPEAEARTTYAPGRTSSVLHHFDEKLLRLRDDMLTPTGRAIAEERHRFTAEFAQRFRREWHAEDVS